MVDVGGLDSDALTALLASCKAEMDKRGLDEGVSGDKTPETTTGHTSDPTPHSAQEPFPVPATTGNPSASFPSLLRTFTEDKIELASLAASFRAASAFTGRAIPGHELLKWTLELFESHERWSGLLKEPSSSERRVVLTDLLSLLLARGVLRPAEGTDANQNGEQTPRFTATDDALYEIPEDTAAEKVKTLKQQWKVERIGLAMSKEGLEAHYPVVLVPGYGSSALAVWSSEEKKEWEEQRIWIGFSKLGGLASMKRVGGFLKNLGRDEDEVQLDDSAWLSHMKLDTDCYSDPPGIKIRPLEGLSAVDYLSHSGPAKAPSYVFGPVIRALKDVGYHPSILKAAPYDWRLPLGFLERRDSYFTNLKSMIENMAAFNKKRVVVLAHSMGNCVFHAFLLWVESTQPGWVAHNIHAQLALGAPFLGAPKALRGLCTGDALGLELFLEPHEALAWNKRTGAVCSLLPLCHSLFPQPLCHITSGQAADQQRDATTRAFASLAERDSGERPAWYRHLGLEFAEEEGADVPLHAEALARPWLFDRKRSDDLEGFHDAVHDHGLFTKLLQSKHQELSFQFRPVDGQLEARAVLYGLSINKFLIGPSAVFHAEELLAEGQQFSWYEKEGHFLYTKVPLAKSNLFLAFRLLEGGRVLAVRLNVAPLQLDGAMESKVYNLYLTSTAAETPEEKEEVAARQVAKYLQDAVEMGRFAAPNIFDMIRERVPVMWDVYRKFYLHASYFLGVKEGDQFPEGLISDYSLAAMASVPAVQAPAVDNLWCIYGTGLETEVSYYYAMAPDGELSFDHGADTECNPAGLKVEEGVAYETVETPQPAMGKVPNSGDGTVPYVSLAYASVWKKQLMAAQAAVKADTGNGETAERLRQLEPYLDGADNQNVDRAIEIVEVPGSEHREMLADETVHLHILHYLCTGASPFAI